MSKHRKIKKLKEHYRPFKTNYALEPSSIFCQDIVPVQLWFDGACWPGSNGGHTSWGLVVKVEGEKVFEAGGYMGHGKGFNNNVGEYQGCIEAMKYLIANGIQEATVYGDSNMVVQQMLGHWQAHKGEYVPYYEQALVLRLALPKVKFCHVPRSLNSEADALAGAAGWRK